jgi:hypothetical protein
MWSVAGEAEEVARVVHELVHIGVVPRLAVRGLERHIGREDFNYLLAFGQIARNDVTVPAAQAR